MRVLKNPLILDEKWSLLKDEWDYENNLISPENLSVASNIKIHWKCSKGHTWEAFLYNRTNRNQGCPTCNKDKQSLKKLEFYSKKKPLPNSFVEKFDKEKNSISVNLISSGSSSLRYWICNKKHSFLYPVRDFITKGNNFCPICEKEEIISFSKMHPDLEPFYSKENKKDFEDIPLYYTKKLQWECPKCSHSVLARSDSFKNSESIIQKCDICQFKRIINGVNDIETAFPIYSSYLVNKDFQHKSPKSKEFAEWRLPCGHSFEREIRVFIFKNSNCIVCMREKRGKERSKKASESHQIPQFIIDNWSDNNVLHYSELSFNSRKNIELKYKKCGHTRYTTVRNIYQFPECTVCSGARPWSKQEKVLLNLLRKEFPNLKILENKRFSFLNGKELDIYIPELKFAIEYNGNYWHDKNAFMEDVKNNTYTTPERMKTKLCESENITLVHIWEDEWRKDKTLVLNKILNLIK